MARLSFSQQNPSLQLAWDSTSMGTFKECPRKYYYNIVRGYVQHEESVHLTFGLRYHEALEAYDNAKALGASHTAALRHAVRTALTNSWDKTRKRPWVSDHKYKNRFTLVRSVVWYLNHYRVDALTTVVLANGKAAVELSWRLELGQVTHTTGEPMLLCGHLDKLAVFQGNTWIVDHKTTQSPFYDDFFDRYSPDNQCSTYTYAGQIIYKQPVKGIIYNVAQVLVESSRFQRGLVTRSEGQLLEWRSDLNWWLELAESCAHKGYWPQNDKSCGLYGGCPYRSICGKDPGVRSDWLRAGFKQRSWDPLVIRGDI